MERAACQLALSVGYEGAATVEYLYSLQSGEFFFLELNPRLQVEHPVTEWIAALNLPALQLQIGMGIPLWKMPGQHPPLQPPTSDLHPPTSEIHTAPHHNPLHRSPPVAEMRRLYGQPFGGGNSSWQVSAESAVPFDFATTRKQPPLGHVVAVRITSEDPDDGFKPTGGRIQELSFRTKPDVWAYFSVKVRKERRERRAPTEILKILTVQFNFFQITLFLALAGAKVGVLVFEQQQ